MLWLMQNHTQNRTRKGSESIFVEDLADQRRIDRFTHVPVNRSEAEDF